MALLRLNQDGTYASRCALCGLQLTNPIFATSHFMADRTHDLYRYSDAAMHWDCYLNWPDQARFASLHFEACLQLSERVEWQGVWDILWKSTDAFLQYGRFVEEASLYFRKSGTNIRVERERWQAWLDGEWREQCRPGLEYEAVAEYIPKLARVALPEPVLREEGPSESSLDELVEAAELVIARYNEETATQVEDGRSKLPPLDKELEEYLRRYYSRFMTEEERSISGAFFAPIVFQLRDEPEKQAYYQAKWDELQRAVLARILREHYHEIEFNRCPKCGALARTPTAKQCRKCFHHWHELA